MRLFRWKIRRNNCFFLLTSFAIFLIWNKLSERHESSTVKEFSNSSDVPHADIEINGHNIVFKKDIKKQYPEKLSIHLVFHSHVDPGWLWSFDQYYEVQVRHIISTTVRALAKYPQLKFIWAEMSFLEKWWNEEANEELTAKILRAVEEGRLEITTGSWVMMDEATPLFYSAIENLIEGHQFLKNTFGISPNTSWSVDPFGHGAMMPQLLPHSGIESMVIGRVNSHTKQKMKEKKSLRFHWLPLFGKAKSPEVYVLPNTLYTTWDMCPNRSICACYHLGSSKQSPIRSDCPPEYQLDKIKKHNAGFFVNRLIGQLRETQKSYGSEDLLMAVGEDFFFGNMDDFDQMVKGYTAMIEYISKHPELNVEMRFSTLSEFFSKTTNQNLPKLRGDFFPYTAGEDVNPWWTGYFVHRPYTKGIERRLQNSIRALDIFRAIRFNSVDSAQLKEARRNFILFQHHDGITGTSRPAIMLDFQMRMTSSLISIEKQFSEDLGLRDESYPIRNYTTGRLKTMTKSMKKLIFFSSQTFPKEHLLTFRSSFPLQVFHEGNEVPTQITKVDYERFKIAFRHVLKPLTTTTFNLIPGEPKPLNKPRNRCFEFGDNHQIKSFYGKRFSIQFLRMADNGGAYVIEASGKMLQVPIVNFEDEEGDVFFRRTYSFLNSKMVVEFTCINDDEFSIDVRTDVTGHNSLLMSIQTSIRSSGFFTDINGMHSVRREHDWKLPYEANIYPVASSVFIQDKSQRLTLFAGQPTGATSRGEGTVDVLLDRRVAKNDGKGLSSGDSLDFRSSRIRFRVLLEGGVFEKENQNVQSLRAARILDSFIYFPYGIFSKEDPQKISGLPFKWPCNIQLVLWRHLENEIQHLVLRKAEYGNPTAQDKNCHSSLEDMFKYFSSRFHFRHSSLTANKISNDVTFKSFKEALRETWTIASFELKIRS